MNTLAISKHLLWKDYRQLRPALVGCWLIMATILLLTFVRQLLTNHRENILPDSIMLVLAAPTLVAMAASGILIGHERQTRTWNWSSSLPIPWSSSLISRFVIWVLSSIVMVATLLVFFLILIQVCRWQGFTRSTIPDWVTPQLAILTALVVPLVVYICFSLAALLWNDTVNAFVIAAIVVSILFVLTIEMLPRLLLGEFHTTTQSSQSQALGIGLSLLFLGVIAGAFMVKAYHWRWTSGQLASIGWGRRLAEPTSALERQVMWRSVAWLGPAPSEFQMLLVHSIRSALVTRILILVGTTILSVLAGLDSQLLGGSIIITMIGAGLMGTTVFSGDQAQSAYKFFADRGVSWQRLLLAHVLPALVMAMLPVLLLMAVALSNFFPHDEYWALLLAPAVFAVGVFCSLCATIPMLSLCMAVGAWALALFAMIALDTFWWNFLSGSLPSLTIKLLIGTEVIVLLTAIVILMRRWLIYDRVRGVAYYVATLLIAIVPTHLLAVCLCFLATPNVPWQGLPEDQVKKKSDWPVVAINVRLPIYMQGRLYTYDPSRAEGSVELGYQILGSQIAKEVSPEQNSEQVEATVSGMSGDSMQSTSNTVTVQELADTLKELESALDRLSNQPQVTTDLAWLNRETENTAWLASYATQELRDLDMARRAWKVNRQLLGMVDYSVLSGDASIDSRMVSVMLRARLSGEDWAFLSSGGSLAELRPEPIPRDTWARFTQMWATAWRQEVRQSNSMRFLPPLRWYLERQIAYRLEAQLQLIYQRPLRDPQNPEVHRIQMFPVPQLIATEERLPRF